MKIKHLYEMNNNNRRKIVSHQWFSFLLKFNCADFGGDDPNCKNITLNQLLNTPYHDKIN